MDVLIMDMGDGVKGESSLPGYKEKIELLAFNPGGGAQITGDISTSGRGFGRPDQQDFTVIKYLDAASPALQRALMDGKLFPQVSVVSGRREREEIHELVRYKMSGVVISNLSVAGGGGDKLVETWTLSYDKITWDYQPKHVEGG